MKAHYEEEIPKNTAVLFLSNHQNALLDPLLITIKSKQKNYFLTRANVFSKPIIAQFLKSLQMLPVYRMRDGIGTITKNREIFTTCARLLQQKKSIVIFPEGSHSLKRSVRPLSKGFTRIIDEFFQDNPNTKLLLIPVGVNYQTPLDYGDSASVYFGKSIKAETFLDQNSLDIIGLKEAVSSAIKRLTVHIENNEQYDNTINKLKNKKVDFTNPKAVNTCLASNFMYNGEPVNPPSKLYSVFKVLVIAYYWLPYIVWKMISVKIKEEEFVGTFRFAVCITIAPLFLLAEIILISVLFGKIVGLYVLLAGIILPQLALRTK